MMNRFYFKELEQSNYQAESGYQASIVQHPYRKRAPKREVRGRVLHSKKGSRIRGMGSKRAAMMHQARKAE
jgi:hypothetical protein